MAKGLLSVAIIFCLSGFPYCGYGQTTPTFVAIGPPATEISLALGLLPTGRSAWDTWPPILLNVPQIGDPSAPNRELLLSMQPDILLADSYSGLALWAQAHGMRVAHVAAYNQADVLPTVAALGKLFHREAQAKLLARLLEEPSKILNTRLANLSEAQKPTALLLAGDPWFSFSNASGRNLLQRSGAVNMCAAMIAPFPLLSREWIRTAQPDFIIIAPDSPMGRGNEPLPPDMAKRTFDKESQGLFAAWAKAGRLLVLDERLTYGLRSDFGALLLAKRMHPDLFDDIDALGIYNNFLAQVFGASAPPAVYP